MISAQIQGITLKVLVELQTFLWERKAVPDNWELSGTCLCVLLSINNLIEHQHQTRPLCARDEGRRKNQDPAAPHNLV